MNASQNDDGQLDEVFAHALDSMAKQSSPDHLVAVLPSIQRTIGRRRAAKTAGVVTCSFLLAGAVGVGAWVSPWHDAVGPVVPATPAPPVTPTPTPTPPPESSVSQSVTALADPRFAAGRLLPFAWNESHVCGGDIANVLADTTSDRFTLELVGEPEFSTGVDTASLMIRTRITDVAGEGIPEGYQAQGPILLLTQSGKIVEGYGWNEGGGTWFDVGLSDDDDPYLKSLPAGGSFETYASASFHHDGFGEGWHCGTTTPDPNTLLEVAFQDELPAGTYEAYAFAWYISPDGHLLASDPMTVTVP